MLVTAGAGAEGRPGLRSAGAICRNLGQIYWRIRHEWSREDDYMSLPVLRLRRQSCLGRPEVAGAALISATVNVARERGVRCCAASAAASPRLYSRPLLVRGARAVRRRPVTGERDGSEGPVTNGTHVAAGAATAGDGNGGTATLTVPGGPSGAPVAGDPADAPHPAPSRSGSRLALSNWRVRWRILALIVVPTLAAVILGGLRISSGVNSALADKRTQQLAQLNADVVSLTQNMEDERDLTAGYIAAGRPQLGTNPLRLALINQENATDESAQQVTGLASSIGSTYSSTIRQALNAVLARISDLPQLRAAASPTTTLNKGIPIEPMIGD